MTLGGELQNLQQREQEFDYNIDVDKYKRKRCRSVQEDGERRAEEESGVDVSNVRILYLHGLGAGGWGRTIILQERPGTRLRLFRKIFHDRLFGIGLGGIGSSAPIRR